MFTRDDHNGAAVEQGEVSCNNVPGLPVAGYAPTQTREAIVAVDIFKELEERVLRHADSLTSARTQTLPNPDVVLRCRKTTRAGST